MSATVNDNTNGNLDNIVYTIKDTNSCVPIVTLSARDNQNLSKRPSTGFERSVYWNEYKKMRIKVRQMNIDIFSNQTLLESIDYLF